LHDSMMRSSSGGIFTLLARSIIAQGGVVFGAKFNDQWEVVHSRAEDEESIGLLCTSKYVQSHLGSTFTHIKGELRAGRKVLFCGTPCQAAALNLSVEKRLRANLTIVDFICHGVPSPKVWSEYLEDVMKRHGGVSEIGEIRFRDKSNGWRDFNFIIRNKEGKEIVKERAHTNNYVRGFLTGLYMRPSCHHCPTKKMSSGSDFTIADFWGVRRVLPDFYDYNGVSLVAAHNTEANKLLHQLNADIHPTNYTDAIARNPGATTCARVHPKRDMFFKLWKKKGVIKVIKQLNKLPLHKQIIRFFWRKG
ncbi:MAG: Coenzyme F420 hydrogenase/dehydrogenase, beta subunit C-terminal domain, partial [Rikenellaceae bacterium]